MRERETRSMLVIATPDGRLHGQHLTDAEAIELCRHLLEIRGQLKPERPAALTPKHLAEKGKARGARRAPGAGRKPVRLDGPELSRVVAMHQEGASATAIARETHHGIDVIRRELARLCDVCDT